jgi:L,D-transpeptidase catalytic domain/Putative peptidoglycan binding domain
MFAMAAAAAVLFGGAVVLYGSDAGRSGVIAKGLRVGGVDVGGLHSPEARAKLAHYLVPRLARPIVLQSGQSTWKLRPRRARFRVDLQAAVDDALARSGRGSIFVRTARKLFGGALHANIAPRVSYDRSAVERFVADVSRAVDRPARDATVLPVAARLEKVPGRNGVTVDAGRLQLRLEHVLSAGAAARVVSVPSGEVRPKLTLKGLVHRYPNYIVVNRSRFQLDYFHNLKLARTYPIAVGRQGLETPAGLYEVQDRQVNPSWQVPHSSWAGALAGRTIPPGPDDPLKARWLGFNGSAGIHGTDDLASLGTAASHGCIRMSIPNVEQLYRHAPVHTPVYIR